MPDQRQLDRLLEELRREGITDPRVLSALGSVPREAFVPPECRGHAYRNIPLPIGDGQTISQPFVVALMTQALQLSGTEKVLEVGTGSGYQSAILVELGVEVFSLERIESLARSALGRLTALGYGSVRIRVGDGSLGWPEEAPFDAIIVTAACPRAPESLLNQLAEDGRMVLPMGSLAAQDLRLLRKEGGRVSSHLLGPVRFVPLIGMDAWNEDQAKYSLGDSDF